MSIGQNYDNYFRVYYLKNRKKILARTKEYRRKYAREYYYKKQAEKLAARTAAERASKALLQQGAQVQASTETPPYDLPELSAEDYLMAG